MTQRPWTEVVDDPAARHLVVARLSPKSIDEPSALLDALIERLGPIGEFALLTRCEEECAVVMCAFTHPDDARALADAVEAQKIERYAGWGSQRGFTLDRTVARAVIDALLARAVVEALVPNVSEPTVAPVQAAIDQSLAALFSQPASANSPRATSKYRVDRSISHRMAA